MPTVHIELSYQRLITLAATLGVSLASLVGALYYFRQHSGASDVAATSDVFGEQPSTDNTELETSANQVVAVASTGLDVQDLGVVGRIPPPSAQLRSRRSRLRLVGGSSVRSNRTSMSCDTDTGGGDDITPGGEPQDHCGRLGVRALKQVITNLEKALANFETMERQHSIEAATTPLTTPQTAALMDELRRILELAYTAKEKSKQRVLDVVSEGEQFDTDFGSDAGSSSSSDESGTYASAQEEFDLDDLDENLQRTVTMENVLYKSALLELEHGVIPQCRRSRTDVLLCDSDTDFLAKLHCVRLVFDELLLDRRTRTNLVDFGRDSIAKLLTRLGKGADEFVAAYNALIEFLAVAENREDMETELRARGVCAMNFFDIAIDFLLLEAFDHLVDPPSTLVAVIQNRWLSNGFKRSALDSTVWTMVMAKRRMMSNPEGFVAKFLAIAAAVSPTLAWGFMGPEEELRELCDRFRCAIMTFVCGVFSFEQTRYTVLPELRKDVESLMTTCFASIDEIFVTAPTENGRLQ